MYDIGGNITRDNDDDFNDEDCIHIRDSNDSDSDTQEDLEKNEGIENNLTDT